ncbi:coiled-coil domain-containing protein 142 isoform X2 [Sorex araneus]|uniref:coiled-coil domain-containing protein 142 isoform X2 n=1 Tax=Sorex araneus TaxID=42254 RepID=UPI002433E4A0|nr:coiled-coil domain-containing protein 142 isoform X2 [Sorex araneus]
MAQASRAGGLPPLAPTLRGAGEEPGRRGPAGAEAWSGRRLPVAGSVPRAEPGPARWAAAAVAGAGAREPSAGTPMPPALRRLRAVLLRLQREREQLLYARDCARQLQAAVRLVLQSPSPGAPPSAPARDPLALPPRGPGPAPLLLARPVGLAARHLEAALETQLRALGREPAGPRLSSRLADALGALPAFQQLQGRAAGRVPGAARPFPPARVLRLLTAERGCQLAIRLDRALWTSGLRDQLRKACQEERELLPGVLGLLGGVAGSAPRGPGLGGAGALWSQYWALLWAACAQSLSINLGPWRDPRAATQQLDPEPGQGEWRGALGALQRPCCLPSRSPENLPSKAAPFGAAHPSPHLQHPRLQTKSRLLGPGGGGGSGQWLWNGDAVVFRLEPCLPLAPLPAECEKELVSLGRSLWRQSLIWNWDQGFCRALGCSRDDRALPSSSHTSGLWQQLFPPLLDALREDTTGLHLSAPPAPAPLALGLCTLQATLLWFGGRAQQHLAAWAPTSFLLLTQKDLPPLLQEAEGLHRLVSEESWAPELGWQLGQLAAQVQRLATHIQLLPEEYLSLFFQECQRQAAQGFEMYMPRGRYWRHRLLPELPSIPSEYAGLVVRTVLEPVLQGLQELPTQAQASALGQALTAILGAWLDHILTHEIRFRGHCSSDGTSEWFGSCWRRSAGACLLNFARRCSCWASSSGWMGPCCACCSSHCPRLVCAGGRPAAVRAMKSRPWNCPAATSTAWRTWSPLHGLE